MVITILSQKYNCGCNKGMSLIEKRSLLPKLNAIIEWDLCEFPKKIENGKEIEDREFLGKDPELAPGNCFLFKGQVIAVNSVNELVLVVSETGYMALDRVWEENIKPELDMKFNTYDTEDVVWEVVEDDNLLNEFDEIYSPNYCIYNIWKEHFVEGRGFLKSGLKLKVQMKSDNYIRPIDLIFLDWKVKYKSIQLENDEVEYAVKECISWFYNKYKRIK